MVEQIYPTGLWLASFSNLLGDNIVIILAESIRDNYSEGIKMFLVVLFADGVGKDAGLGQNDKTHVIKRGGSPCDCWGRPEAYWWP